MHGIWVSSQCTECMWVPSSQDTDWLTLPFVFLGHILGGCVASRNGRWVLRTGTCEQSVCIAGHPEIPLTSGILRLEVTVGTRWLSRVLGTQEQDCLSGATGNQCNFPAGSTHFLSQSKGNPRWSWHYAEAFLKLKIRFLSYHTHFINFKLDFPWLPGRISSLIYLLIICIYGAKLSNESINNPIGRLVIRQVIST